MKLIERVAEQDYRRIFRAWEVLRLYYIGIYLTTYALILGLHWDYATTDLEFMALFVTHFILANLFFMLGPGVEAYLSFLGWRVRFLRPCLFVAGVLFACMVAWVVLYDLNQQFYYKCR